MRGLYIHIPFCKRICSYCDFPKMVSSKHIQNQYMSILLDELDSYKNKLIDIDSIYIGGGTPNSIELDLLEKLLIKIDSYNLNAKEYTIEANPELITDEFVKLIMKYKINRISLGVQTINPKLIKLLNRNHDKDIILNSIKILKMNMFNNINCDFIYAMPYQTMSDLKNDIDFALSLDVEHLSFYSLILEDNTIMMHNINKGNIKMLDEDTQADMYDYVNLRLKQIYNHYEISNYSKEGFESIHNIHYWKCDQIVAVGLSGSGYIDDYRYTNYKRLKDYLENRIETKEYIDINEQKNEYLLLGLRMLEGVSISKYKDKFSQNLFDDYDLSYLINNKLLIIEDDYLKIPEDKMILSNLVFSYFVR